MTDEVTLARDRGAQRITLTRPSKKNAINLAMYCKMTDAIHTAIANPQVRVIVIEGSDGCFTSGNDLGDFIELAASPERLASPENPVLRFMKALELCPKPVVALVDGVCVGVGTTLLLHCDFVFASHQARFSVPFASLGLCPEYACSYLLPRLAGHVKAAEWLMLGEEFSAVEARRAGLINAVVNDLVSQDNAICKRLCALPPQALQRTKKLIKAATRAQVSQSMQAELEVFRAALVSAEFVEAATAFFEKREPDFSSFE